MEYKRLTKHETDNVVSINGRILYDEPMASIIDRLAVLEDMIDDGTLIELPCKVGDKFYEVFECTQEYYEYECCGFSVVDGRVEVINEVDSRYYADEVFFSKEEAEARLAELRGNA